MRYLGLDLGTKTLGVSISDPLGMIASSYKVINHNSNFNTLIDELRVIISEKSVHKIVLGIPKNMDNSLGERAMKTLDFKKKIESTLGIEVVVQDERLTTVQANKMLITNDTSRKKRKTVIDKVAATIILQSYLDRKEK